MRLDPATVETLARRIAELLPSPVVSEPAGRPPSGRLMSATEVSAWWGVSRGWVYQHATELGAVRIGNGERPRLRFDPDRVAEHLKQPPAAPPRDPSKRERSRRRSPRISGEAQRLAFQADPELSSLRPSSGRTQPGPGLKAEAPNRCVPAASGCRS